MESTASKNGFTLIEILIVIAIIAILALVVFVALNPGARFADARNSNRQQNIEVIGKAILHYDVDNSGSFPSGIPTLISTTYSTGFNSSGVPQCDFATAGSDPTTAGCEYADVASLQSALVPKYISAIPTDSNNTYNHYFVALTPDSGHVVVMVSKLEKGVNSNPSGSTNPYYQTF